MKGLALAKLGITPQVGAVALGAFGLGAALMYLVDPGRGHRRRAILVGKGGRAAHELEEGMDAGARDLAHQAQGLVAKVRSAVHHEQVPDDVLMERVRAELGRSVSHPRSIEVRTSDGRVTLTGLILRRAYKAALRGVRHSRGVREVEDRLEVHGSQGKSASKNRKRYVSRRTMRRPAPSCSEQRQ